MRFKDVECEAGTLCQYGVCLNVVASKRSEESAPFTEGDNSNKFNFIPFLIAGIALVALVAIVIVTVLVKRERK